MEAEKQATIRGTPTAIESWIQSLSGPIDSEWSRGTEIEGKIKGKRKNPRWPICLIWSGEGRHPKAAVFLQPVSDSEVRIASIAPIDRKSLAAEDRGAALVAFEHSLIAPRATELQLAETPTSAELAEMVSPRAMAHFAAFVQTANKTILHSGLDLPRWHNFLIQLHRDRSHPARTNVEAALKVEAFSPSVIQQLLEAYDNSDDLLSQYDAIGKDE
ncbi:MAG TPA: hypothetical protein VHV55_15505 [Pirellulales bacterium]|nr:hypothetical protein [Pirellulales bacterium]